jgi:hypothetical protein
VPAPDARRLLVIVGLPVSCVESAAQVEQIMTRLKEQTPRLRAEIARSISRRSEWAWRENLWNPGAANSRGPGIESTSVARGGQGHSCC